MARSAKKASDVHEETDEVDESLQHMEKQEEEFDAVLATNISGLDDLGAGDTSGDNNLLGDISLGDLNDSKQDAEEKPAEEESETGEQADAASEEQGLDEIKEEPELE